MYCWRVTFDVIVAADLEWGIGKNNGLPWPRLKGDLAHFKRMTSTAREGMRNAIIMGRKTWDSSEVRGRPLPGRLNIVITRRPLETSSAVASASSLDAALGAARGNDIDHVFVVGGAEILREAFGHRELGAIYLTRIDGRFDCDVKIPDLDALGFVKTAWDGEQASEDNGVRYRIEKLVKP